MKTKKNEDKSEPTLAPGMSLNDQLAEEATEQEINNGDATSYTRLYVDRAPSE